MPRCDEITFSIHGLDVDARVVRADVFAQKFSDFLNALKTADKLANGQHTYGYLLPTLREGSAVVTVRERPRTRKFSQSSIAYFQQAAEAIYNGDRRNIPSLDPEIIRKIGKLSRGASQRFAHAEISFADNQVIRIDDYLQNQAQDALLSPSDAAHIDSYRGRVFGSFEGMLKEIDSRGTMLRGKLVLVPSSTEIDCVMNKDQVPDARESFDKRVIIKGIAHYDGRTGLPARFDVQEIYIVRQTGNLTRWRGAFAFPEFDDSEDF